MYRVRLERRIDMGGWTLILRPIAVEKLQVIAIRLTEAFKAPDAAEREMAGVLEELERAVVGWEGLTAGMLRRRYGVVVEREDGQRLPDNAEVKFHPTVLNALVRYNLTFVTQLMKHVSEQITREEAHRERVAKNS